MPPRRPPGPEVAAAEALARAAPLAARWIERLLAGHEPPLTPAQHLALRAAAEPGMSGGALARDAGVSEAAASQVLAGLERAGLIARAPAAADRRRHELALTPAGRRALASADALLRERLAALLAGLPAPEAEALARALGHVAAAVAAAPPPRRPRPPPPPRGRLAR